MSFIKVDNGIVFCVSYAKPKDLDGWIAYDGEIPKTAEGFHLEYREGKVVAVSDRDASEERRMAYEQECDPLLIASLGYTMEGDDEAAQACRAQYLAKKAEIRTRIPDEEGV